MKIVMDSDALIKVAKASVKSLIVSNFDVCIPLAVRREVVDEGIVGRHPDAPIVGENIRRGKLTTVETGRIGETEKLIGGLNLQGGEADTVRLFKQGNYYAVVSDDSKFIDILDGLGIPYLTVGALLVLLWKTRAIAKSEAHQYLDRIKEFISSDEYLASAEALERDV